MEFRYQGYEYEVKGLEGVPLKHVFDEEGNFVLSVATEFPDDWCWALVSAYHDGYCRGQESGKEAIQSQIISVLGLN